ncbi:MAG: hypothetical protein LUH04_15915, partial [Clostridium sp.]|nr:hypothetical protein [Clostridium sp.]
TPNASAADKANTAAVFLLSQIFPQFLMGRLLTALCFRFLISRQNRLYLSSYRSSALFSIRFLPNLQSAGAWTQICRQAAQNQGKQRALLSAGFPENEKSIYNIPTFYYTKMYQRERS